MNPKPALHVLLLAIFIRLIEPSPPLSVVAFSLVFFTILESQRDFDSLAMAFAKKGLQSSSPALIIGKSGVRHGFAFALIPESGKAKVVIDTELSVNEVDEMKVLKFYVKVFDVSPENAVLCVCPKLSAKASELAKDYGITVLENEVPRKLVPMAEELVKEIVERPS